MGIGYGLTHERLYVVIHIMRCVFLFFQPIITAELASGTECFVVACWYGITAMAAEGVH